MKMKNICKFCKEEFEPRNPNSLNWWEKESFCTLPHYILHLEERIDWLEKHAREAKR